MLQALRGRPPSNEDPLLVTSDLSVIRRAGHFHRKNRFRRSGQCERVKLHPVRAVIIGAGIGGLAAAVALRRVAIDALVIERLQSIREVGAGLSIWPNAVNALRRLALDTSVMASASVIDRTVVQTAAGRPIAQNEFGTISRTAGAACLCLQRAVLQ